MEKTYKLLDHNEPMPLADIKKLYKGYWVFIVNAKFSETIGGDLLSGIPVIIGSMPYDGAFDGIYEQYKSEVYEASVGISLLPNNGFISSLRPVVGCNFE